MATTTINNQEFTLERFMALSNWDKEECELVFQSVILDKYNSTRANYESDEKWYLGENQNLRLSSAYFEVGYYKQAASTSEYFLKKSEKECKELREEIEQLKTKAIHAQVSAEIYQKKYEDVFKREFELMCENSRLKDELNAIRA